MNTHEFALYTPDLDTARSVITLTDQDMIHRIVRVLRLQSQDSFILFDHTQHTRVQITSLGKKEISCELISKHHNHVYEPSISFVLPLLKRDAFEAALYLLVEAGVNDIYPVITAKAHRKWGGQRERDRFERIIISAAEQCKNFNFPILHEPVPLAQALQNNSTQKLFFDAEGLSFAQVNKSLGDAESFTLLIGPEGDLIPEEKALVDQYEFIRSKLTPTILRAQDAAGLAACMIRSLRD